jgi:hypothetical protein
MVGIALIHNALKAAGQSDASLHATMCISQHLAKQGRPRKANGEKKEQATRSFRVAADVQPLADYAPLCACV